MAILAGLQPERVFHWFEELCRIPHGSGNTKAISDYLVRFARDRGLAVRQDEWNNVVIKKPASAGYEAAAPVLLQGHMDMVCEKEPDCKKDMAAEGLELVVEGDTVYAKCTTLGGDDGIAVAMILALLESGALPHPALEAVLTVDEETGMIGAAAIDLSDLRGRLLINLDSEVEGVFTAGCAGGATAVIDIPVKREPLTGESLFITVSGLTGGHSGIEINRGRANAVVLLGRILDAIGRATTMRLCSVSGGSKDNAIPVSACATLVVENRGRAAAACRRMEEVFRREYAVADGAITVSAQSGQDAGVPMDADTTRRALTLLQCAPNGVQEMSREVEGLVQTSLNLGILTTSADSVRASFCVRSSVAGSPADQPLFEIDLHALVPVGGDIHRHAHSEDNDPLGGKAFRPVLGDQFHPLDAPGIDAAAVDDRIVGRQVTVFQLAGAGVDQFRARSKGLSDPAGILGGRSVFRIIYDSGILCIHHLLSTPIRLYISMFM